MALRSKNHEENLVEPEQVTEKQIGFDLEFDAVYVDEDSQSEAKKFYTISGKESW